MADRDVCAGERKGSQPGKKLGGHDLKRMKDKGGRIN
jgi:hypothetical protein